MKKFIVMIFLLISCYHVHGESTKYPKIMLNVNEHVHPLPDSIFAIIDDMWNSKTDDMEGKLLECEDLNSVLSLNLGDHINKFYFEYGGADDEVIFNFVVKDNYVKFEQTIKYGFIPLLRAWYKIVYDVKLFAKAKLEYENLRLSLKITDADFVLTKGRIESNFLPFLPLPPAHILGIIRNTLASTGIELGLLVDETFTLIDLAKGQKEYSYAGDPGDFGQELEALTNSLPIDLEFVIKRFPAQDQLWINMNFLHGYTQDNSSFNDTYQSYTPGEVTSSLEYAGFGYLDWGKFKQIKPYVSGLDTITRIDTLINRMNDMGLNQLRIEAMWSRIWPEVSSIDANLDTSLIDDQLINAYMDSITAWGGWTFMDTLVGLIHNRSSVISKPVVAVGVGHQGRPPKYQGKNIAPGSLVRGESAEYHYQPVPKNVYLYWLKLFTHCVVRRYKDKIAVWQAENELNAARFAESFDWWRRGNAWSEDGAEGFQTDVAKTIYYAIKYEDRDLQVVQAFHILNAAKRIKEWHNYYDILGLNLYPHLFFGYPNMAFMIGEYVWAARRILTSLGDTETKIWITETGYGAQTDYFPNTDLKEYTEERQAAFIREALNSCAQNGAKAFIWYLNQTFDDTTNNEYELERTNQYLGLYDSHNSDSPKMGKNEFKRTFSNLSSASSQLVTLANKYGASETLGGSFNIQGVINGIESGSGIKLDTEEEYLLRTNHQFLAKSNGDTVQHHHWNTEISKVSLIYTMPSQGNPNQVAFFQDTYPLQFSVDIDGNNDPDVVKEIQIRDPWLLDGVNEQPNIFYTLKNCSDTTFYNTFYDMEPFPADTTIPYYSIIPPGVVYKDGKVAIFKEWQVVSDARFEDDPRNSGNDYQKAVVITGTTPAVKAVYYKNIVIKNGNIDMSSGNLVLDAPQYIADSDAIYAFDQWKVYESDGTTPAPSKASFSSASAFKDCIVDINASDIVIKPTYENCFDESIPIIVTDGLVIPPGANYEMPTDVAFIVDWGGNLLIEGTREKPVRIKGGTLLPKSASIATTLWDGILIKGGKVSIKNTLLSNADVAVKVAWVHKEGPFVKSGPIEIFNCSFVNNTRGIEWHDYPSHAQQENAILDARNNIFYGNDYGIWYDHNPRTTIRKSKIAYNDFYNNTHDIYEIDAPPPGSQTNHLEKYNNIFTNPLFLDATNENYNLSWGSPCIDAGDTSVLVDPDLTNPDLGAFFHVQLAGTLTYDLSVGGEVRIEQNLTIPDSVTLAFLPGATVKLEDDVKIDVYGKLLAVGAENDSITFTSVYSSPATSKFWDRIKFNDSANDSSRFEYCRFKYGTYGIYAYKANITVLNCAIDSMYYYGIYVFNGIGDIRNNIITNCRYGIYIHSGNDYGISTLYDNILNEGAFSTYTYGIYLYKSSPELKNNEVNNYNYGISCFYNASPKLGWLGQQGYNYVHNCNRGLNSSYSNPFLGQDMCNIAGGHNYFVNNNYHVYAGNTCNIMAENNWWGSSPPNSSKFYADNSYIDYNPYLTSGPLTKPAFLAKVAGEESSFDDAFGAFADSSLSEDEVMASFDPSWPLLNQLIFARNLIELGFPQAASVIANNILKVYPDSSEAYFALDLLWQAGRGYTPQFEQYKVYLDSLTKITYKAEVYEEAELLLDEYQSSGDLSKLAESYKKYKSDRVASRALFNVFIYYLHTREDIAAATQILSILESEFPQSVAAAEARMLLGSMSDYDQSAAVIIPQTFELLGNYPNPFNPETRIRFALPISARVEIIIVNLLGQKIKTIRSESLAAGIHELTWDSTNENGIRMSTGMYLYTFKAESTDRKETFQKNGKLLLLK